jgi:hypothetical protein
VKKTIVVANRCPSTTLSEQKIRGGENYGSHKNGTVRFDYAQQAAGEESQSKSQASNSTLFQCHRYRFIFDGHLHGKRRAIP